MKMSFIKFVAIFSTLFFAHSSSASNTGAALLGAYGWVLLHEAGHATTSYLLGGEVLAFKPYPHKVKFLNADGSAEKKWVAGLMMHGLAAGVLANEYRYHWHQRALPEGKTASRFSVGFSTSY